MKKAHKRFLICVLIVVVLLTIVTAINVNAFYNEGVDERGLIEEDMYQSEESGYTKRQAMYTKDLKNALVSNVYIHEYAIDGEPRMQIKFRVSYYLPFMQDGLPGTKLSVTDENETDLGYSLSVYSDTVAGFHGEVFTLYFAGEDVPKTGEKIHFSFVAEYMSGTIVIEIGTCNDENGLLSDLQISRDEIEYVLITNDQMQEIKITDRNDFAFLFDYVYEGEFPDDRLHELFLFPAARSLTICGGEDNSIKITVLEDGSIVTGTETTGPYKMYTSAALEKANAQALLALIEKYEE